MPLTVLVPLFCFARFPQRWWWDSKTRDAYCVGNLVFRVHAFGAPRLDMVNLIDYILNRSVGRTDEKTVIGQNECVCAAGCLVK